MSIDEREVDSVLEGAGKSLLDIVEEKNRTLNKVNMIEYRIIRRSRFYLLMYVLLYIYILKHYLKFVSLFIILEESTS